MALDVIGLGLANSYTDEEIAGGGAIKGKNAVVDDISKSGKKNTVRFKWTLDNGTVLTGNMEVLDGEDGNPGPAGKGIASIAQVTGESKIIITYDDGTTSDPIDIPTVAGQDGQDGVGVPVGGTTGQVLKKKSGTNYDTEWTNESGGESQINYSTTEKEIGTWIDGKTLYRKVFEVTTGSSQNIDNTLVDLSSLGIENVVSISAVLKEDENNFVPPMNANGVYISFFVVDWNLKEKHSEVGYSSKTAKVIMEYTKRQQYVPIEYIETTGTQYLNLNYTGRFRAKLDALFKSGPAEQAVIGSFTNTGSNVATRNYSYMFAGANHNECTIGIGNGGSGVGYVSFTDSYSQANTRYKYEISNLSGNVFFKVDDNYMYNENIVTSDSDLVPIYLACVKGQTTVGGTASMRIYGCKIYSGMTEESIVRDLVPMIDTFNNNTPGLYDKVNDVFYTNAGSGSFVIPT